MFGQQNFLLVSNLHTPLRSGKFSGIAWRHIEFDFYLSKPDHLMENSTNYENPIISLIFLKNKKVRAEG